MDLQKYAKQKELEGKKITRAEAQMTSSKNADTGTGRGTTTFGGSNTFSQAFKEARDAGKGTFSWNGKKYTTEMAGAKKPAAEETKFESSMPSVMSDEEGTTTSFKRGGKVKKMASGGSASRRADGCCVKGKTQGKIV
jgi:hypothetical protein